MRIVFEADEKVVQEFVDAVCGVYKYQETIHDLTNGSKIKNPVSRKDFAIGYLKKYWQDLVRNWEIVRAADAAAEKAKVTVTVE